MVLAGEDRASMPSRCILVVAIAIAGCAATPPAAGSAPETDASAQPTSAPSPDAAPTPGERARVSATLEGKRIAAKKTKEWRVSATFTVFESSVDGQRRHVVEDFSGWSGDVTDQLTDGPGFLAPLLSPILLKQDGSFDRLEDPAAVRASVIAMIETTGYARATDPAIMSNVLSDAGLDAVAKDVWSSTRAMLRHVDLRVGERRELPSRAAVPQLGGSVLDIATVVAREADRPCPGDDTRTCAHFDLQTTPDRKQVAEILEALPIRGGMPKLTAFEMHSHAVLTVDAHTEAPYRFRFERSSEVAFGTGERAGEQSLRTYEYTYER
jgi:hypothetical protein